MKKKNGLKFALWVCCLVLATQAMWAQPNFQFTIYATDQVKTDSVILGLNSTATYGIDLAFNEFELPPLSNAPGPFEFRVADINGQPRGAGRGLRTDVRQSSGNDLQVDVFTIIYRSSDDAVGVTTVSWSAGLESVGNGGYVLNHGGNYTDMTVQESYDLPNNTSGEQTFEIIFADGYKMRTFTYDSIANARDSKGKQAAEKRKNYLSDGTFTFANTDGAGVGSGKKLVVKFGSVCISLESYAPFTSVSGVGTKEVTFTNPDDADDEIDFGESVTVTGTFDKGKQPKASWQYYTSIEAKAGKGKGVASPFRLHLKMPNINNVGDELYAQAGELTPNGLFAGNPAGRSVFHPKWKDVMKSIFKKGGIYQTGPARCFNLEAKNKPWIKPKKSYAPDKYSNKLLAEQLTLKFNIEASEAGKIPVGVGDLAFSNDEEFTHPELDAFNDTTLNELASLVDGYLADCETTSYVADDLYYLLHKINGAFSASFDTATFGDPSGLKAQGTSLDGVKPVVMCPFLYRTTAIIAPANRTPYSVTETPEKFSLDQNYPNPFNPTTNISFTLPADAYVTVRVYNTLGQEVATLANHEEFTEGENEIEFNAQNFSSGVYFYRVVVNDGQFQQVKKMMLMK